MPPIQDPERVAAAILAVAADPRRLRYVPRYAAIGVVLHWLWPRTTERLLKHALQAFQLVGSQPVTHGNLFASNGARGAIRGVRRPVVSLPAFVVWIVRDLAYMSRQRLFRRKRRWQVTQSTL